MPASGLIVSAHCARSCGHVVAMARDLDARLRERGFVAAVRSACSSPPRISSVASGTAARIAGHAVAQEREDAFAVGPVAERPDEQQSAATPTADSAARDPRAVARRTRRADARRAAPSSREHTITRVVARATCPRRPRLRRGRSKSSGPYASCRSSIQRASGVAVRDERRELRVLDLHECRARNSRAAPARLPRRAPGGSACACAPPASPRSALAARLRRAAPGGRRPSPSKSAKLRAS